MYYVFQNRTPMYPQVIDSNDEPALPGQSSSSSANMYPTIDMKDLVENLFPDKDETAHDNPNYAPSAPPESLEETLLTVPGAILHLIDKHYSVELAIGDLVIHRLRQGENIVAVLASVADEIQWPLTKDVAAVKLDHSHYFFSFRTPKEYDSDSDSSDDDKKEKQKKKKDKDKCKNTKESENDSLNVLSYGLTIASKGQEDLLKQLDGILEISSTFSVQKVDEKAAMQLGGAVAKEVSPADLMSEKKKEVMEERCAAYWTTLAPNVEDYGGVAAKLVATGSGQLIKGILWCGDVTVDRLKWGNEILRTRMTTGSKAEVSPETLERIKRVKRVTKMTEKVALAVLSGVVKVSGFFTSSVANSKAGKKFFGLLPGEMLLASLDGFSKICDAVEIAGKNVMSTSSTVTTGLISHRYGEEAAKAASEGLDAAGHAVGTAWAVFKIRKALNPKSVMKPSSLAKSAAKSAAKMAAEKAQSSKS